MKVENINYNSCVGKIEAQCPQKTFIYIIPWNIYLWRKVVCFVFFCSYEIDQTGMFHIVFLVSWESSRWGGVHGLGSMMFGLVMQKFLNIEWFLHKNKNKNHSWKFWRNWNVPLVFLERSWWVRFNGIHLVKFGFSMLELLIFELFLSLKIQINSEKPSFGRKNQLRTW